MWDTYIHLSKTGGQNLLRNQTQSNTTRPLRKARLGFHMSSSDNENSNHHSVEPAARYMLARDLQGIQRSRSGQIAGGGQLAQDVVQGAILDQSQQDLHCNLIKWGPDLSRTLTMLAGKMWVLEDNLWKQVVLGKTCCSLGNILGLKIDVPIFL